MKLLYQERAYTFRSRGLFLFLRVLQDAHPARLVEELLPGSLSAFDSVWSRKSFEFLMEMMVHVPCGQVQFGTDMERFVKSVEGWIAKG